MNKRVLIIGNTDGLAGVPIDILNYKRFFKSSYGGMWIDDEIIEMVDSSKKEIETIIEEIKESELDYLIVVFSGHGGIERETILEINPKGETVQEGYLSGLCVRQLNIFDCCRAFPTPIFESLQTKVRTSLFSAKDTRWKYEKRIMEAAPQQISLYACSEGEVANDTNSGGVYSRELLLAAQQVEDEFMLVGQAHLKAKRETSRRFPDQNPDGVLPRLLSRQQLIISVNWN